MAGKVKIYFRADGNNQIGLGHVIRSCALAQMLSHKFFCVFIIQNAIDPLKQEILKYCDEIIEVDKNLTLNEEAKYVGSIVSLSDIVVLDGYKFNTEYQDSVKATCSKLVCIDDIYAHRFVSDVVINPAGGVSSDKYNCTFYTKLFLGPEYVMLRKPFYPNSNLEIVRARDNRVLILFGGADPGNETARILSQSIIAHPDKEFHVVLGPAYRYLNEIIEFSKPNKNIKLYVNLDAIQIADLMRSCGIAITAPSTVAFEYLYIGGVLYLQIIADNQKDVFSYLTGNHLASPFSGFISSNDIYKATPAKFNFDFVKNIRKIFDDLLIEMKLTLREVSPEDKDIIFEWVNDPETRRQSYNSEPVSYDTHTAWFRKKMADSDCKIYILTNGTDSMGQIRFEIHDEQATISYLIDEAYRGKGLGYILIKEGVKKIVAEKNINEVVGYVKQENVVSSKLFQKLGFSKVNSSEYPNSFKYILTFPNA